MNSDSYEEYREYYDFSGQFQALEDYCRQYAGEKGADVVRLHEAGEEDDWEDQEGEEGEGEGEGINRKKRIQKQSYIIKKAKVLDTGNVLLPNGRM